MRPAQTLERLKTALVPGKVYRRSELARISSNVDRHLVQLVKAGQLKKVSQGMYAAPRATVFGEAPPEEHSLLQSFLKDDHFVVYGPSQFNALGLGTTQLYNTRVVFNRKRVGEFQLGSRTYTFHRWREAPKVLTQEFLVVELLNRLNDLAEDRDRVVELLKNKLPQMNSRKLIHAARHYGTLSTLKKLEAIIKDNASGRSL
ncbi:MAG: hypothetical protein A2583_00115 [Bdellovibrionales bacterium RIFOXYD1_FULL_53_11]|nr:MAG: hypothetical protein A2583_00115 [Bdellovibrionales bacterium RIFOXYD1_FULL_53_11]